MSNELPKLCYTKEEAAEILGVKETSVEWMLRKNMLPRRKICGKLRFTLDDLQVLEDGAKVEP